MSDNSNDLRHTSWLELHCVNGVIRGRDVNVLFVTTDHHCGTCDFSSSITTKAFFSTNDFGPVTYFPTYYKSFRKTIIKQINGDFATIHLNWEVREVSRSNPGILALLHACREHDWLPCWPPRGQQVLHQRWIAGIHCMQVTKHASEGSTLVLKPRAGVTRSPKQGYQWPHKKDSCPPKN